MLANRHLVNWVDTKLLNTHWAVLTDAVGALRFPVKCNKFPPTINLMRSFSSFSGFTSQTIFSYVTFLCLGTLNLGIKMTIFVPLASLIPWYNCPNLFAKDLYQIFLSGTLIRCLYSWATQKRVTRVPLMILFPLCLFLMRTYLSLKVDS